MKTRLQRLEELARELSFQNDPDRLVRAFGRQQDLFHDSDGLVTVNCRDLEPPAYRLSRSSLCPNNIIHCAETHRLPFYDRGLLGELLYAGRAIVLNRLEVENDDPAREHFVGMRSLACAPGFHQGRIQGMSVLLHHEP